ncbi:MAG: flagellar hook assembly protein FlgD [Deltaproteobacteria bacterium]|nr:flagellar hook assembly protein FlgD [Deltaproteobacteria bacterium]
MAASVSSSIGQGSDGSVAVLSPSQAIQKDMGKEDFLRLLVTQLRYQDPLSPDDPKEFVAQLAQFSSLEQQINANQNLESVGQSVSSLKESLGMSRGVNLLGKTVKGLSNSLSLSGGRVTGASYQLAGEAKDVTITIFDRAGGLVRTLKSGSQAAGLHQFAWDGKDAHGNTLPDGTYTYQVAATDSQGKSLEVTNYFTGRVQEVFQDQRGIWLKIDGREVPLDNIVSVSQPS